MGAEVVMTALLDDDLVAHRDALLRERAKLMRTLDEVEHDHELKHLRAELEALRAEVAHLQREGDERAMALELARQDVQVLTEEVTRVRAHLKGLTSS